MYGHDLQQFLATELPEPPWLIPGLVTTGNMLIAGRPKIGKSIFSEQLAFALSDQQSLLCWLQPTRKYRVLYVQLDAPLATFQEQIRHVTPLATYGFTHFDHPQPECRIQQYFLSDERTRQHAQEVIARYNPEIVFWDNLTRMDFTSDYNDRAAVSRLYSRLATVWQGANVFLAHSNKERPDEHRHPIERISGSQAIAGDSDCGVLIEGQQGRGTFSLWSRIQEEQVKNFVMFDEKGWQQVPAFRLS